MTYLKDSKIKVTGAKEVAKVFQDILSRLPKVLSQTCGDPLKSSINMRSSTIIAISDSSRRGT